MPTLPGGSSKNPGLLSNRLKIEEDLRSNIRSLLNTWQNLLLSGVTELAPLLLTFEESTFGGPFMKLVPFAPSISVADIALVLRRLVKDSEEKTLAFLLVFDGQSSINNDKKPSLNFIWSTSWGTAENVFVRYSRNESFVEFEEPVVTHTMFSMFDDVFPRNEQIH